MKKEDSIKIYELVSKKKELENQLKNYNDTDWSEIQITKALVLNKIVFSECKSTIKTVKTLLEDKVKSMILEIDKQIEEM